MSFANSLYRFSSGAINVESTTVHDTATYCGCDLGSSLQITFTVRAPLFWRRRLCRHQHAKQHGIVRDGKTYCTACEQLISVGRMS